MQVQIAREEYLQAQRLAQKEQKTLIAAGKKSAPAVLDDILEEKATTYRDLGVLEIQSSRIVGTVSAGRTGAFTAGFRPLLPVDSEFASKWISLCAAHLSEGGIRDPILCYEYLGNFYVQEGNKRVSVLKHFGAPRIQAQVRRILPPVSQEPRIRAYYEFLDFYRDTGLYQVQFRRPGDYAALLSYLGKESGEVWDDRERKTFSAYFRYFKDALRTQDKDYSDLLPEEALLLWLQVYPFQMLGDMTAAQLKKSIAGLKEDLKAISHEDPVEVNLEPATKKTSLLDLLIPVKTDCIRVAFVHAFTAETSEWTAGHDLGRKQLEEKFGDKVRVRSYFGANTPSLADALLEKAVFDGASVVFTTTAQLGRSAFRMAVKYPKVRFFNCAVNSPYSSVRSYYGRLYEAKFITGAIAGVMARDGRIGYVGTAPILGVPASINAFALGAQMTNPDAKIILRWSCLPGSPQEEFISQGIRVISNREVPTQEKYFWYRYTYGTYLLNDDNTLKSLASPVWMWGKFYETVISAMLSGSWEKEKNTAKAVNYWWGMESGLIDIALADDLPDGVSVLAKTLQTALKNDLVHPFWRRIVAQDGTVKNDGSRNLYADEILRMNWLCENIEGAFPEFAEIENNKAKSLVREQGIFQDRVPREKEGTL